MASKIAGDNRLLPVDADASSLDALEKTSLPLEEVRDAVAATGRVGLIVLDACRSDPFAGASGEGRGATSLAKDMADKVKPGLGRIGRAENILFAFASAPRRNRRRRNRPELALHCRADQMSGKGCRCP